MELNVQEFISLLLELVIIPAVPILTKYLVDVFKKWAEEKALCVENETISGYLLEINDTISQAVMCTTQTYVDTLKKQGNFTAESQKIAFDTTKKTVLTLLAQDAKDFIKHMYGDVDLWLDSKIEQVIQEQKTKTSLTC